MHGVRVSSRNRDLVAGARRQGGAREAVEQFVPWNSWKQLNIWNDWNSLVFRQNS